MELNHLAILTNHQQSPKKSILRKSCERNLAFNQNNPDLLTPHTDSFNRPKVLFSHIDSFVFDPQLPCRFLRPSERAEFYRSSNAQQMQCLCHHQSKTNYPNKYKIKLPDQGK